MQQALNYEGDDVITIFKGLQFDIGAPPQFMDFRYTVHDRWHGEFHLDHCGALLDVEPMGPDYVTGMCHDIEDPTFDATAVATNPRAQVRPLHRPPRQPADRSPHCAWTVIIDSSYPEAQPIPALATIARTRAATWTLAPITHDEDGATDYSGPLLSDVDFGAFSHSALVRIADEVSLQMHLLNLSFVLAVTKRAGDDAELVGADGVLGAVEREQALVRLPRHGLTGLGGAVEPSGDSLVGGIDPLHEGAKHSHHLTVGGVRKDQVNAMNTLDVFTGSGTPPIAKLALTNGVMSTREDSRDHSAASPECLNVAPTMAERRIGSPKWRKDPDETASMN
jgi:hypothetical protein